ncbi:hypothetical protein NMG60_11017928 [Bertholletia excelsa]
MAGACLGYPFTMAQLKELERQAMIYKYMMASVPVPPHLLLPINTQNYLSTREALGAEPGRCKRTDGKKWRCPRDVAPNQKYCERHMNRGRTRSRKPVEVDGGGGGNQQVRLLDRPPQPPLPATQLIGSAIQPYKTLTPALFFLNPDETVSASSSYKEQNRCLNWTTEGEMPRMGVLEREWQRLLDTSSGLESRASLYDTTETVFQQACNEESLDLLPYPDFLVSEANQQTHNSNLFLNSNLLRVEKNPQMVESRGFIDAWSNENQYTDNGNNECSVSSQRMTFSPSLDLWMAMAAGDILDEGMARIDTDLGFGDSGAGLEKLHDWLGPSSWVGSAPGGPLAEALGRECSDKDSSYSNRGGGDPAIGMWSPTGVLQRTVMSVADGSGCTSPNVATAAETIPFRWLK